MNFAIHTLGCKVNQYESNVIMELLEERGLQQVQPSEKADIYIINSCTVTAQGDKKSRQILRRLKRQNPDAIMVLTGCYPQAFPEEASKIKEADIITGATNRHQLVEDILSFAQKREKIANIIPHERHEEFEKMSIHSFNERTRAFLKIQDGCERYCTYCIIPYSRGFVRSKNPKDLALEVKELARNGYKEIVLVGINLSSYGKGEDFGLVDAIKICAEQEGIERVRLGSIEPDLLSDEELRAMAEIPEFCPQFHLSLQSGCDETLKRMNRHYDTAFYRDLVSRIRKHFENASITTDIMVGFAGETDEEFEKSARFAEEIGFAKSHVFPYSIRKGTTAEKFKNHVSEEIKRQREKEMLQRTDKVRESFLKTQVGLTETVLTETKAQNGYLEGYTKNYTPVRFKSESTKPGDIVRVKISSADKDFCLGEIIA